jgi:carboxymethylenebutenolidase
VDTLAGAQASDVSNITYPAADGTSLVGYLAQPAGTADGRPAVLMIHEWWGLTAEIREMADKLADEGYVVLAADTYRGRVASTIPGALALRLTVPQERVNADMQAAYEYLTAQSGIAPGRIGVIGFCYGGGVALRFATLNQGIAATVNLYGDVVTDPQGFGMLLRTGRPVLGIFGALDAQIPVTEPEAMQKALAEAKIPHEVKIYPGVGHAFVNPDTIRAGGAAAEAWAQILGFFEKNLKGRDA